MEGEFTNHDALLRWAAGHPRRNTPPPNLHPVWVGGTSRLCVYMNVSHPALRRAESWGSCGVSRGPNMFPSDKVRPNGISVPLVMSLGTAA